MSTRIVNTRPVDPRRAIMTVDDERNLRESFRNSPCESCGINDGTIVPAHMNFGDYGGMGFKARGMLAGLCAKCHNLLDRRTRNLEDRMRVLERLCQKLLRDRAVQWCKTPPSATEKPE